MSKLEINGEDYESFEENINYTRRFILLIGALMLVGKIIVNIIQTTPVRDLNKYNFMIPKDYFVKTDKPVKKKNSEQTSIIILIKLLVMIKR